MPQVPYNPVPIAADAVPTPELHLDTPGAAFGTTIGKSIHELGNVTEKASNELFHRAMAMQQLANETEAKEADAKYMMEVGKLHADFSALQGASAHAAFPKYMEDIQSIRKGIRGSLSNDQARKMYDSSSLGTMGRTIFNGAGHAATQMKVAAGHASIARVDMAVQNGYANPDDDVGFERTLQTIREEVASQGELAGWLPEQTADQTKKAESKAISMRIAGKAKTSPWAAYEMLEGHKGILREDDYNKLQNTVITQMNGVGARNISDKVLANVGEEDKSLNTYVKEAVDQAKKEFPNLTDLPDHVEKEVIAKYSRFKAGEKDFRTQNIQTIYDGIEQAYDKGKVPASIDDLKAGDEKIGAAYDALPPSDKLKVRNAITNMAKKGGNLDPVESLRTRELLRGRAINDPDNFVSTDLYDKSLPLTTTDRKFLVNLRGKMQDQRAQAALTGQALTWLRNARGAEMQALNVYKRTDQYKDDYDHFTGALATAIDSWRQEKGSLPTPKDVVETIGPELLKHTPSSWFPWRSEVKPVWAADVPDAWSTAFKTQVTKDTGREPDDEQVRRAYIQSKLIELYKTTKPPPQ